MRVSASLAAAIAFLVISAPVFAQDGPFGVRMGMPADKLEHCENLDPDENSSSFWHCERLPKSHPDIKYYTVMAYPNTGVCNIIAETAQIEDETLAYDLFKKLVNQLSQIYGKESSGDDELSIWSDDNYLVRRNSLHQISAFYLGNETILNFTFANEEQCDAAEASEGDHEGAEAFR